MPGYVPAHTAAGIYWATGNSKGCNLNINLSHIMHRDDSPYLHMENITTVAHYTWFILNPCIPTCPQLKYNHIVSTLNQCTLSMTLPYGKDLNNCGTWYIVTSNICRGHVVSCFVAHVITRFSPLEHVLLNVFWIWQQLQDSSKEELETTEQFKVRKSHVPIHLRKSAYSFRMQDNSF